MPITSFSHRQLFRAIVAPLLDSIRNLFRRNRLTQPERALELYGEAVKLAANGRHRQAVEKFSAAIRLSPDTGKLFHHRGASFAEMGSFDAAVFDYDTAVRLTPAYPDTYLDRGNVRHAMGEPEKALKDYSEAIRLRPDWAEAHANRAVVHAELGDDSASQEDARRAVSLGVDSETLDEMISAALENRREPGA